eukprot:3167939-Pleurochrysis_carterae.AAC.1
MACLQALERRLISISMVQLLLPTTSSMHAGCTLYCTCALRRDRELSRVIRSLWRRESAAWARSSSVEALSRGGECVRGMQECTGACVRGWVGACVRGLSPHRDASALRHEPVDMLDLLDEITEREWMELRLDLRAREQGRVVDRLHDGSDGGGSGGGGGGGGCG